MRERSKDLRVRRTLTAIRKSFNELVLARDYREISITDLTERAGINRKTFYLHYTSLDDLIDEIEEEVSSDLLEHIGKYALDMDLSGCITYFYKYLESCSKVQKKLMCDESYSFFYNAVVDKVLNSDEFSKFFNQTEHPSIVRSYTKAITSIYKDWLASGRDVEFKTLTDVASVLVGKGYAGVIKK
ncbi:MULTISPECIES: TetR/AcrR family transcriptional regulator [Pseudobutyrivibrio]|jgi:AcrR family transcriptional regulator|uniref:Transcriptional regulator, TetR family n=1 Tax=Pseudobutyrivibrio ruminis DSM 9787 TaxID=1123011 RepID=A0A285SP95_9FIRM|nr:MULTISPECIES: TetR/AcrR family transcriptional regulator [Pseudobutyrivibrio]MBE5913107.1 TetR family transcriptional regulator [Pseudobutyrivibrio ruminis]SET30976.1 transcriptional regulator, TetR family [Pseudobutyrivibrio sp. C4]SFO56352.1 transcriptional regulator, TetR family [Pseudobutyrivibrio sp. JW11]SOC10044.1 transcriptional regulator, TetR family [Pseudobutyrivibrio ruminis DSM 9787]